jgi:predicted phage terminase large subunit-like protein
MLTEAQLYASLAGGFLAKELLERFERYEAEQSLLRFFEAAWPWFDPAPLEINWHHEAIAEHLEAVSRGEIRRLLINVPPRSGKTSLVSIVWPAWAWVQGNRGPLMGPQVRFLCVCYAASLSLEIATTARRLIMSEWYRQNWGSRVKLLDDEASRARFATTAGGYRIAASIEGGTLGRGGDIKIIDDPHKVNDVESELERQNVIRSYDEALATRVIDPRTTAEVVIMQRLHEDDLSGHILTQSLGAWDHLMIPMQFDPRRYYFQGEVSRTSIGWADPRGAEEDEAATGAAAGALMWESRFDQDWAELEEQRMGSVAWSGQMQQTPIARGAEIIKPEWWQLWESPEYPEYGTCIACLDTAYKEKETADYNALTVWAAFAHPETEKPKLMLRDAWQKRANLADLVREVIRTCSEHKVERLLIEDASRGIDVQTEIHRLIGRRQFQVELMPARGDKVARLNACVAIFENGVVYAPDKEWADMVIQQVTSFPRGRHDDLVDTVSMAIRYLRAKGVAVRREEVEDELTERRRYRKAIAPLYDV